MPVSPTAPAPSLISAAGHPARHGAGPHEHATGHDHAQAHRLGSPAGLSSADMPRIGPSVLRLSLAARLVLVSALLAVLWTVVLLVAGGGA